MPLKAKASRNRTIEITPQEAAFFAQNLISLEAPATAENLRNQTVCQNLYEALPFLPDGFADLVFADPPYNLDKSFDGLKYRELKLADYQNWLESWFEELVKKLKPEGSLYLCGDWKSAAPIQFVLDKHLFIRNRITFEREKGRGAKTNWKNCSEDIWFATRSERYYFNVEAVKLRKKVVAPYRVDGKPKDWEETAEGDFRVTYPSNLWTDITIPFWSMPENTPHPTQKPEKLMAKIILASSREGDLVFDPFAGSGSTLVTAKKLNRAYCGVEMNRDYCLLAEKRLAMADEDREIQGYADGVFRERNS